MIDEPTMHEVGLWIKKHPKTVVGFTKAGAEIHRLAFLDVIFNLRLIYRAAVGDGEFSVVSIRLPNAEELQECDREGVDGLNRRIADRALEELAKDVRFFM